MNVWRPSVVYQVLMLALGALLTLPSAGQVTWRRSYGGFGSDNALSVRQTTDGGYIVAGATGSFGNGSSDIYVVRIDEMGEHLWSRYYGGVGVDVGIACRELEDGYIIAGTTATGSIGGYDMILIRTDEEGTPVWQRNYGSADWDLCNAFALVEDGFILAGVTYGVGTPLGSGFAIKTDLNGEVQWNYTLPADQHSEFHGVIGTSDNGAALCGSVLATNGNPDGILAKVDLLGAEQWLTVVGGDSTDQFSSVVEGPNGEMVLCGATSSNVAVQNIYLVGLDMTGALQWERLIGNSAESGGGEVQRAQGSGYVFTGFNTLNGGERDMILTVTDNSGWFQYGSNYGDGEPADGSSIAATADGGYVVAGWCENYGPGLRAMYVVKTDGNGQTADLTVAPYLDPVGVDEVGRVDRLELFPNPLGLDRIVHIVTAAPGPLRMVLTDMQGRIVLDRTVSSSERAVELPLLGQGAYHATIGTTNGEIGSVLLLIQ